MIVCNRRMIYYDINFVEDRYYLKPYEMFDAIDFYPEIEDAYVENIGNWYDNGIFKRITI